MRVKDLLSVQSINLNGAPTTKEDTINQMVELMVKRGNIADVETYRKGVFAREEEGTTGIGEGIAIPHCKSDAVKAPGLAAMVIKNGVDYEALDDEPVHIVFLIAAPNTKENVHLEVLARLSALLMDEEFVASLINAKTPEEFLSIIDAKEAAKEAEEAGGKVQKNVDASKGKVIAVTACPTGIAHTYMAAEALEKAGEKLGIAVKVETRGSGGAKNILTDEDIKEAAGVIIACEIKVPMERFAGKHLIECKVADGISKAEELVTRASNGEGAIYEANGVAEEASTEDKGSVGHQIYTHLMSGVSHMLPFVIGGGIMVALAFLIDTLAGYGATAGGNFGVMTPLSAFLKYAGGLAMGMMVPVLAGYIAYSIADRPGLAVGFAGGLLASSGNAVLADYINIWTAGGSTAELGGFSRFIANFAFQGSGNTVSGFLGGIVAGFLAGYVVLWLKKITENFPKDLDGIRPTLIYPLGGILIIAILMCFIFNPLVALINTGLANMLSALANANLLVVMGLVLGGMMAIDMGGPINKAAYVYGTLMLEQATSLMNAGAQLTDANVQACYIAMAAVMVGGMCPPVGIALATRFFPKKFTQSERDTWVSNLVMGASFITEGAIPFAASDPAHVIPCTLVGSAVAGGLSALFGCTLMAPHGGIFVFATVGNPLMYIVAWAIGSIITCVMLGFIKKDADQM